MSHKKISTQFHKVSPFGITSTIFGYGRDYSTVYNGYLKCKLVHAPTFSVIIPDQIYLENEGDCWFQPLAFTANILCKTDKNIMGELSIDISMGHTLKIDTSNYDFVRNFDDGSCLYKCQIKGPKKLKEYATGHSYFRKDFTPVLKLYHHTEPETKEEILKCKYLIGSKWNIQGTKKLTNVSYAYFTCLDKISKPNDLKHIAMASDGKIHLIVDDFNVPGILPLNWQCLYGDKILELMVRRENTLNRKATLSFFVDSTKLASQHIYRHVFTNSNPSYYEICNPFIYRVGLHPNGHLHFEDNNHLAYNSSKIVNFNYVVVGDSTTLEGLSAPYDEENTKDIFKIEKMKNDENILDYWFKESNKDHFSKKEVKYQKFEL